MPTIRRVESFQHRVLMTFGDFYDQVNRAGTLPNHGGLGVTFDTTVKRTEHHSCSLKIVEDGVTVTSVRRAYAANVLVGSFYFRVDSAPGAESKMFNITGAGSTLRITMGTDGKVHAICGTGTNQASAAGYADGAWHRIDFKADTSTGTATLDVQVDGTAITQSSVAVASANMTNYMFGSNQAADSLTVYFQDGVFSQTAGDYPLGDHICLLLEIAATGTHSQGAGAWSDQAGTTTDAALLAAVDDAWNGTTPELSQTGEDYAQQTANDGTSYLEYTIDAVTPSISAVWGACLGILFAAEDATTACNGEGRLVDSGGTTLGTTGLIDPSGTNTSYNGYRPETTAAPSGGWSETSLEACRIRFGFSTDAAPDVVFNSAMVEYAAVLSTAAPTPPAPTVISDAVHRAHSW